MSQHRLRQQVMEAKEGPMELKKKRQREHTWEKERKKCADMVQRDREIEREHLNWGNTGVGKGVGVLK